MSITVQPTPTTSMPAAKSVSLTILALSLALAVSATAAIIFAVLFFRQPAPAAGGTGAGNQGAPAADELLTQKGTVSPRNKMSDTVFYEIPYGSPPNLTLTSSKRHYTILSQEETGFTWMADPLVDDLTADVRKKFPDGSLNMTMEKALDYAGYSTFGSILKPNLQYEDFTWEARELRANKEQARMQVYAQQGTFFPIPGEQGEIGFKLPYATPPNIELSSAVAFRHASVLIVECRPTGFKWKHSGTKGDNYGEVTWKAKGIRATEIPKSKPD